ncbi:hypothetical protein GDO81_020477 [Engystomops pustulosus]|uniref:Glycosyltransferase 2-like domain-containing protein n=1 Tax=Engystomops pustulosus TaxID=76066 RepID=A0AAV6Z8D1_ENGPU|nr:hypothetical protein GDO81_020477 [Engystomops pustulosus]
MTDVVNMTCGLVTVWQPLRRLKGLLLLAAIASMLFYGFLLLSEYRKILKIKDGNKLDVKGLNIEKHNDRMEVSINQSKLDYEHLKRPVYEKPPLDPYAVGEFGRPVRLNLQGEEKKLEEESIRKHQINIYLSDQISLHRHLIETRNPMCRTVKYDYYKLPRTSVIITFYNEAWSTLLRTIYSVLETSPDILLEEVILVDDCSDKDHLKEPLERHISGLKKVRLIRAHKREGLIRARIIGASKARGEVLTFLDCHCECQEGWLEPLLERIRIEKTSVVCPVIDVIDWNTFEYLGNEGEPLIGGFDWRLSFIWNVAPKWRSNYRHSLIDVIRYVGCLQLLVDVLYGIIS